MLLEKCNVIVLMQEKSLLDYVYDYWQKFMRHLNEFPEGSILDVYITRQRLLQVDGVEKK